LIGDIALWNLPYAEAFLEDERVKIVALKRNRNDTVNSFNRWFTELNHFPWVNNKIRVFNSKFGGNPKFDDCYPKFAISEFNMTENQKFPSILQGAEFYYDYYYKRVDELIKKYPERIYQVDSYSVLNDVDEKNKLLDWLGLTRPHLTNDVLSSSVHQTNKSAVYRLKKSFQRPVIGINKIRG